MRTGIISGTILLLSMPFSALHAGAVDGAARAALLAALNSGKTAVIFVERAAQTAPKTTSPAVIFDVGRGVVKLPRMPEGQVGSVGLVYDEVPFSHIGIGAGAAGCAYTSGPDPRDCLRAIIEEE